MVAYDRRREGGNIVGLTHKLELAILSGEGSDLRNQVFVRLVS